MRGESLHLTLAFLGNVAHDRMDSLVKVGQVVAANCAFSMRVDQVRCWKHNRIVWCGPSESPPGLERVVDTLRAGLRDAGFPVEDRPFAAHATLLRDADCDQGPTDFAAFDWPVNEVVLVESNPGAIAGARFVAIGRWQLAG